MVGWCLEGEGDLGKQRLGIGGRIYSLECSVQCLPYTCGYVYEDIFVVNMPARSIKVHSKKVRGS
jgi:hypothetical protein